MIEKVQIEKKEDREQLALILFRNGYTVKEIKTKQNGTSKFTYFVEFEKMGQAKND